jgi:hypothetical protein
MLQRCAAALLVLAVVTAPAGSVGALRLPAVSGEHAASQPVTRAANEDQVEPAVAFGTTSFLVVWTDGRGAAGHDIFGARVSRAGEVLDPSGIPISTARNSQFLPAVRFDGTNFVVVWTDQRTGVNEFFTTRISPEGTVLDPEGVPAATRFDPSTSAFDGTNFLVVSADTRSGFDSDIFGTRVTQDGTVLDPDGILISTSANNQLEPVVAFDGTNFMIVWKDTRGASPAIFAARVRADGTALDDAGFPVAPGTGAQQREPAIAFDGTNFLVAWLDFREGENAGNIVAARVTRDGTVLDPEGVRISPPTTNNDVSGPAVAFDGTNYFVVWRTHLLAPVDTSVLFGARVTRTGTVLDAASVPIATSAGIQRVPDVAFDGSNYVVVWEDVRSGPTQDIFGARVSPGGIVLDAAGVPISASPVDQEFDPEIAFGRSSALVVWTTFRGSPNEDVFAARVDREMSVLDPTGVPIAVGVGDQFAPAVSFDGKQFLVTWTDARQFDSTGFDIGAARVGANAAVRDRSGFAVAAGTTDEAASATTGLTSGRGWAVAYQRFAPEAPYGAIRGFLRTVSAR